MTILTQEQGRQICDRVLAASHADECIVTVNNSRDGNLRFARNAVSTSGSIHDVGVAVQVAFGTRKGTATANQTDDKSLEAAVRRAEAMARLAPESAEFVPAVGKQDYQATITAGDATAAIDPQYRIQAVAQAIEACKQGGMTAAGLFHDVVRASAVANSNGVFGYQQATNFDFTCTVRTPDGRGSGWATHTGIDAAGFDARDTVGVALDKARRSVDAKALEPGHYTVILEPAASSDLITMMMDGFDARDTDEGQSFLSKQGGASRLGDKLFDARVDIRADPWQPGAGVLPWDPDTLLARRRVDFVKEGRVSALDLSPYWARKKGLAPTGTPGNIVMAGGDPSTADLIAGTKKGVLVTRTWYVRMLDPRSVMLTGLTRDGTFYIENGKIKYPIKNFRFNESPVTMLNNIEAIGRQQAIWSYGYRGPVLMLVPALKIRDFNFSSLSDAI